MNELEASLVEFLPRQRWFGGKGRLIGEARVERSVQLKGDKPELRALVLAVGYADGGLERYHDRLCTFNDDIQGTAAVAAGTLLAAVTLTGARLSDQRIAVLGAGSAGIGIISLLLEAMIADGLAEDEARSRFFLVDRDGLCSLRQTSSGRHPPRGIGTRQPTAARHPA